MSTNLSEAAVKVVPLPGYTTEKILYPATAALRQELGEQDACIQLQELAMRLLEEQGKNSPEGLEKFLSDKFPEHGISHGTYTFSKVKTLIGQSYVSQTYNLFEKYTKELSSEYRQHKWIREDQWVSKSDKNEKYSAYLSLCYNLQESNRKIAFSKPESVLVEYYRALRVSFTHPTEENKRKAEAEYKSLSPHLEYFLTTYKLEAPNCPEKITYSDFCLFTRAIKYFSNIVNDACDLQFSDIRSYCCHSDMEILKLLAQKSPQKKLTSAQNYIARKYTLTNVAEHQLSDQDVVYLEERSRAENQLKELNLIVKTAPYSLTVDRNGNYNLSQTTRDQETKEVSIKTILSQGSFSELDKTIATLV